MKFLYLLLPACLLFSCKPKTVDYTIKGRLVNSCDNSPIKNLKVQARQADVQNGFNEYVTSDSNGDFELLVSTSEKSNYQLLNLQEKVPLETVDYGDIPLYSYSTIYYRVKINAPHTASDTLWIVNPTNTSQYYQMYGPFHDTVIGLQTITGINKLIYSARTKKISPSNTTNDAIAWYKINRTSYQTSKRVWITPEICNTVADTLTLIVD